MLARIFTRQHDGLRELSDKLEAAGYEVEVWAPGQMPHTPADLELTLETMPAETALQVAQRAADETGADVFVSPGAIDSLLPPVEAPLPLPKQPIDSQQVEAFPWAQRRQADAEVEPHSEVPPIGQVEGVDRREAIPLARLNPVPPGRQEVPRDDVTASTIHEVGSALSEAKQDVSESVSSYAERITGAFTAWQERRAAAAEERRRIAAERERQREEQRQAEQLELQRRHEEEQRAEEERRRLAAEEMARQAERERIAREEMARQAALAAERERAAREQTARIAALRAEQERLAREEMERQAAVVALREREARERREREAALQREPDRRPLGQKPESPVILPVGASVQPPLERVSAVSIAPVPLAAHPPASTGVSAPTIAPTLAPITRPRTEVYPARRVPSARDKRWHQAAFFASVVTLVVMLGFGAAMNIGKSSPIPSNLLQNGVQQQTPFGPASMAATPGPASTPAKSTRPVSSKKAQPPQTRTPSKPSPQVHSPRRRASGNRDDEVVVRHFTPVRTNTAQTRTDGVKRFSDDNK